jgi:hypothetical protein
VDDRQIASQLIVEYAARTQEDWAERVEVKRRMNQLLHNLPPLFLEAKRIGLSRFNDANYWGQRFLTMDAEPLTRYSFAVPWQGFFILPGDKIHLTRTRAGLNTIVEVLESSHNLTGGRINLVCGNQRGWNDTFGFWVEDVAPTSPPDPIIPAAKFWLKADAESYLDNQRVDIWHDRSGNEFHFINTSAANQPTFKRDILSGYPVIRFAMPGTFLNQVLYYPGGESFTSFTEGEIFAIVRANGDPGASTGSELWNFGSASPPNGSNPGSYPDASGNILEEFGCATRQNVGNPTPALTAWRLYNVAAKSNDFKVRLDNVQIFANAVFTVGFQEQVAIGGWTNGFNGDMAEILFYPRVLSSSERQNVVDYLSLKYKLGLVGSPSAPLSSPPPPWNKNWTDAEANRARQDSGYWTSKFDNGLIVFETDTATAISGSSRDARSYYPSRWL